MEEVNLPVCFGLIVRRTRTALGFTQQKLADVADLDRGYLSELERGVRNPTLTVQARLAVALDVRLSELIQQAEEMS